MATFQKRAGKWRAIVRKAGFPPQTRTFRTKGMAMEWAKHLEDEMASGAFRSKGILDTVTVGQLCDLQLAHVKRLRPLGRHDLSDPRRLKAFFGADAPLSRITYTSLAEFCHTRLTVDEVQPGTVHHNIMWLSSAISTGVLELGLPETLKSQMTHWRKGLARAGLTATAPHRNRRPTEEELEKLRTHVKHNKALRFIPYGPIIEFAIESAMRLGEICRIRWDDLDEVSGTIVIRDRKHPKRKLGNHQTVPLLGRSLEIILSMDRIDERIFPYNPESTSNGFGRLCKHLGIEGLRFHDLRHEGVSRLFERGYQIQEVALVSGHNDWGSLKRYANLKASDLVVRERKRATPQEPPEAETPPEAKKRGSKAVYVGGGRENPPVRVPKSEQ